MLLRSVVLSIGQTINQEIDFDTAYLIAQEFGITAKKKETVTEVVAEEAYFADSRREGDAGAGAFESTFGSTMPGSMGSDFETSSADDLPF